jgi:hypothetical protein
MQLAAGVAGAVDDRPSGSLSTLFPIKSRSCRTKSVNSDEARGGHSANPAEWPLRYLDPFWLRLPRSGSTAAGYHRSDDRHRIRSSLAGWTPWPHSPDFGRLSPHLPTGHLPMSEGAMSVPMSRCILSVTETAVQCLSQKGELQGLRPAGAWRVRRSDIGAWIEEKRTASKTEAVRLMSASPASQVRQRLASAEYAYFRLVLVVGPSGRGKSRTLREVAQEQPTPVLNVGEKLSERLVDLSPAQRALSSGDLLSKVADTVEGTVLVLDNTEVLFDPALHLDPLRVLQSLSRARLVVAAWTGATDGVDLTYAEPGHPEYRRYSRPDAILISTTTAG